MERIEKLKEFLAASPEDSFLRHALALEYVKIGDEQQARSLFEELLARDENYIGSYYHLAKLLERLDEIDNAIKYSKENTALLLKITTQSNGKNLTVRVEDNGIGMNKETVKRVFERFYRAHTGNLHNVKGFGLGLSYVKTVVEAQGGEIKVDSVLGRGSIFILDLPLKKN